MEDDEARRVGALRALHLLDTPPEERFDRLTRAAASRLGAPIAFVGLMDTDRQFFKSRVGIDVREAPRRTSFCTHTIQGRAPLVVPDAREDPRFAENPWVEQDVVRFYVGIPLSSIGGEPVGTLCCVDGRTRTLAPGELGDLSALARDVEGELLVGTRLGDYDLEERIGHGGMGVVYRARDVRLGRTVAVKLLAVEVAAEPVYRARLVREARALAAVTHAGVLTVYAIGEQDGRPYFVSEYLPGGTLADRLGQVGWAEAAAIGADVAGALEAIHRAGLVHRDVKPSNVLLDAAGRPKLADFGLVRVVEGRVVEGAQDGAAAGRLTSPGMIMGTLAYMAPEQAQGLECDARADLYGLGTTLYALLTGQQPFEGRDVVELQQAVIHDAPRPPHEVRSGTPRRLSQLVLRLMAKSPAKRGASAASVEKALRALAAELAGTPARKTASSTSRRTSRPKTTPEPAPKKTTSRATSGRRPSERRPSERRTSRRTTRRDDRADSR